MARGTLGCPWPSKASREAMGWRVPRSPLCPAGGLRLPVLISPSGEVACESRLPDASTDSEQAESLCERFQIVQVRLESQVACNHGNPTDDDDDQGEDEKEKRRPREV